MEARVEFGKIPDGKSYYEVLALLYYGDKLIKKMQYHPTTYGFITADLEKMVKIINLATFDRLPLLLSSTEVIATDLLNLLAQERMTYGC